MNIPSYDFGLFEIPYFSELQANEYGIATRFQANTPTSYVDFSLNQLYNLMNPANPNPYLARRPNTAQIIPDELQNFFQQRDNITVYPSGTTPPELQRQGAPVSQGGKRVCTDSDPFWKRLLGICCIQAVTPDGKQCAQVNDDSSVGTVSPSGDRVNAADLLKGLPQGSGVFLLGIIIIVLLILFVRK